MNSLEYKLRPLVSFDWAIKRLLSNKANHDVVEGFLKALLRYPVRISNVLENKRNKDCYNDDSDRVHVIVKDDAENLILVELQCILEIDYLRRKLYGTSKKVVKLMVPDDYMKITKICSINMLYFDYKYGEDYLYFGTTDFEGLHCRDKLGLPEEQRAIFGQFETDNLNVCPEYYIFKIWDFNSTVIDTMSHWWNNLHEWIYFFRYNRIEYGFSAPGIVKARDILDYNHLSIDEQKAYDYELEQRRRCTSQIFTVREKGRTDAESGAKRKYAQTLEEKDKTIEEKEREIAELKHLLSLS
jgi:predicted transposase/invertase (TIGR01784 family)